MPDKPSRPAAPPAEGETRPSWELPSAPPSDDEVEKAAAAENRMLEDTATPEPS